jgi:hypothetical protein
MDKQTRQRTGKRHAAGARARRARQRRTLWIYVALAVVFLVGSVWQRVTTRAAVVQAVTIAGDELDLLPLAEPIKPLRGEHNMNLFPAELPQPQAVPEGADVPRVEIPQASFDFGTIPPSPPVAYVFAIQNTGTAPLILSNLLTSCGCTVAELSTSVIPPGERADVRVVFDPDYHETIGVVTRVVWMMSNDPTQPWLELLLTADVQPSAAP